MGGFNASRVVVLRVSASQEIQTSDDGRFGENLQVSGTAQVAGSLTVGDGGAEDSKLLFDGNAQDYRIGIDDGTDILEIGAGTAHGSTTAIKINSSGHITQLGHQTSPTNGHFLKYDGSKILFDSVSAGGGADVGLANTFTEAQTIAKDQDSELVGLILKNASDSNNTNGIISMRFDLEDTGGNAVDSAKIAVKKEQAFTATAGTQDSSMVFSTSLNGTLTEQATLDSAGKLTVKALDAGDGDVTNVGTIEADVIQSDADGTGLNVNFDGNTTKNLISLKDNLADALNVTEGSNSYMKFTTTNSGEKILVAQKTEFGVDDTGVDVRVFSATTNEGLLYDASEDELGLLLTTKLSFHDIGGGESIHATGDGTLAIAAGTELTVDAATVDIGASTAVEMTTPSVVIDSATASKPVLEIKNTNADANGATLQLTKDGANVADNDVVGNLTFVSEDDGSNAQTYANIVTAIDVDAAGEESGKLSLKVASHDGGVEDGLVLTGGSVDAEVDVTVGNGAASVATIAGNLVVTTDLSVDGVANLDNTDIDGTFTMDGTTFDVTATDAVTIDSVGLSIDNAGTAANITSTTDGNAEDFTIALAGATDSSLILSSTGTGGDALQIATSAGGMDITVAGAAAGEDLDISSNSSINITATEDAASAIVLHANGGTSETIKIHSDQGTAENSITLLSDAGGIDIDAAAGKDVTIDGGQLLLTSAHDVANSIYLRANAGTSETIKIHADQGSGEGSIELTSDAGGVDINAAASKDVTIDGGQLLLTSAHDVANSIYLRANAGTSETIKIHADQGTGAASIELTSDAGSIDINAADNITIDSGDDITLTSNTADGLITLHSAHTAGQAILIDANADAGSILDIDAGILDIDVQADAALTAGSVTVTTDTATFTSANANDPVVVIKNTTNDVNGARLQFIKDKGAAGADGDDIGVIEFVGDDAAQAQTTFAKIVAEVSEADNTDEAGKLSFFVAESDGTDTALAAGLILEGEHATDGQVDVTIGGGTASTTTIVGTSQFNAAATFGVDDTGVDVRFFSATASEGVLYDASEDELGLLLTTKLKFHDIGGGEEIFASANGHLEVNAGTTLDMTAPTVDVNASTAVTITSPSVVIDSGTAEKPLVEIKNTNNDANGSTLKFTKDGANVADGDVIGNIEFASEDDGDNAHTFAKIIAKVDDMTGGEEEGSLEFHVAENDGTLTKGMDIVGLGSDGNVTVDISTHDGSAGGLKLGGTLVTSTAAELNLLDAGSGAMADGLWQGVERIAVATIDSNDYSIATHNLGITIPDNAIITDFIVDITTAFQSAGTSEITLFIAQSGTPVTLISARPFNNGGGGAFFHALGPKGGTTYNFFGGKTDGAGALSLTVGDAALQTAGEARVYVKYIIGT